METSCPKSPDDIHCVHWYDCFECHYCGDIGSDCDCDCCPSNAPCKIGKI